LFGQGSRGLTFLYCLLGFFGAKSIERDIEKHFEKIAQSSIWKRKAEANGKNGTQDRNMFPSAF
jgi:hypothetical protein